MDRTRPVPQSKRGSLLAPLSEAVLQLMEWGRRRQMRKAFGSASEMLLRDIGLTPDDLLAAMDQPLTEEASNSLVKAAMARAANW